MTHKAFFSFHYDLDESRAAQVRNMGVLEGNRPASDLEWEIIKRAGDDAIKTWIARQMIGKSVVIVLIGQHTAGREWINYEIRKGWDDGKGVLGIHVHELNDSAGNQSTKGHNPFSLLSIDGTSMDSIVQAYDPPGSDSKLVYDRIKRNLASWIETAISIRSRYA
jgi:hypothetical protein